MEDDRGGSSTESEYYDLSDDDEPEFIGALTRTTLEPRACGRDGQLAAREADEDVTQWNSILTSDLQAAVELAAAQASRRNIAEPLAVPLDPPVEMLPRSDEYVSPFAPLSQPKPVVKPEQREPAATIQRDSSASDALRVIVDLSLDSDEEDDETDAPTPPETPTPDPKRPAACTRRVESTKTTASPRHQAPDVLAVTTQPPSRPSGRQAERLDVGVASLQSQPQSTPNRVIAHSSERDKRDSAPRPHAREHQPPQRGTTEKRRSGQEARLARQLSCTRCRRLVPDRSSVPSPMRFDCKCCGRLYAHDEFSVRGANRRCLFCQPAVRVSGPSTPTSSSSTRTPAPQLYPTSPRVLAQVLSTSPRPTVQPLQRTYPHVVHERNPKSPRPGAPAPREKENQFCSRCRRHQCTCSASEAHVRTAVPALRESAIQTPSMRNIATPDNSRLRPLITKERRTIQLTTKTPPVRRRRSSKLKNYYPSTPLKSAPSKEQRYLTYSRIA